MDMSTGEPRTTTMSNNNKTPETMVASRYTPSSKTYTHKSRPNSHRTAISHAIKYLLLGLLTTNVGFNCVIVAFRLAQVYHTIVVVRDRFNVTMNHTMPSSENSDKIYFSNSPEASLGSKLEPFTNSNSSIELNIGLQNVSDIVHNVRPNFTIQPKLENVLNIPNLSTDLDTNNAQPSNSSDNTKFFANTNRSTSSEESHNTSDSTTSVRDPEPKAQNHQTNSSNSGGIWSQIDYGNNVTSPTNSSNIDEHSRGSNRSVSLCETAICLTTGIFSIVLSLVSSMFIITRAPRAVLLLSAIHLVNGVVFTVTDCDHDLGPLGDVSPTHITLVGVIFILASVVAAQRRRTMSTISVN